MENKFTLLYLGVKFIKKLFYFFFSSFGLSWISLAGTFMRSNFFITLLSNKREAKSKGVVWFKLVLE